MSSEQTLVELERARSDYLAVSRSAHLYASDTSHEEAERQAWERLELAHLAHEAALRRAPLGDPDGDLGVGSCPT